MAKSTIHDFEIAGRVFKRGEKGLVSLPVGQFLTGEETSIRFHVHHGKKPGPVLLITAGIHGDELNGVEIVRRIITSRTLASLCGTLIAVPVVNSPAFAMRSRYLPDRRDLNRLFPGDGCGSVGSRIARTLVEQLISRADMVLDFHTGAVNRANLPQMRITKDDVEGTRLAKIFAAPVTLLAGDRDGSLRTTCRNLGKTCLLFEGGEALRLNVVSIRYGISGAQRIMCELGMLPTRHGKKHPIDTVFCSKSGWERAPSGGLFTPLLPLGRAISAGDTLGLVSAIHGPGQQPVKATRNGILIGRTNEGVVDRGDAIFHIGEFAESSDVSTLGVDLLAKPPQTEHEVEDVPLPFDPVSDAV